MPERDLGTLNAIVSRSREPGWPTANSISVLFVALEGPALDQLVHAFELRGAAVERPCNGEEIRARAARAARGDVTAPSVIFVDLGLPDAGSDDFFLAIRQSFPEAAVVALGPDLNGERAARLLGLGIPSLPPCDPDALAGLAFRLSSYVRASVQPESGTARRGTAEASDFAVSIEAYMKARSLSTKQRTILRLYLAGSNDKAIAEDCGCSVATVYEHWRRMAKKVGGAQKGDVIADFHRFLDTGVRPDQHDRKSEIP
jgi:DNA-binding NarL/FixJ family response regulator